MGSRRQAGFAYLWEYRVEPDRLEEFRRTYGPRGEWVKLFSRSADYLGTDLYHDTANARRFLTTDYWISREARDEFRSKFGSEIDDLDRRCEALTSEERFLGDFEIEPIPNPPPGRRKRQLEPRAGSPHKIEHREEE
jgi:hypothetical protein